LGRRAAVPAASRRGRARSVPARGDDGPSGAPPRWGCAPRRGRGPLRLALRTTAVAGQQLQRLGACAANTRGVCRSAARGVVTGCMGGASARVHAMNEVLDFEGLVRAQRRGLEALARRLVWDAEEARDVVQGAVAQAWAQRATLADTGAAQAWLRRIVVHRAMSHLRRRRLWSALSKVLFVEPEARAAADDEAERAEHRERLAAALGRRSPKQATAFSLRYLEGLSIDEVADAMAIDRGTVRVHLQRAVRALRDEGVLPDEERS
jgi:RNA polymerase sigma-70 factor (ECF subfamily)